MRIRKVKTQERERIRELEHELREAYAVIDMLCTQVVETDDFGSWLIEQDLTSTLIDRASPASETRRLSTIEQASDRQLAIAWAREKWRGTTACRRRAGGQEDGDEMRSI